MNKKSFPVYLFSGRPSDSLSDELWQIRFEKIRNMMKTSSFENKLTDSTIPISVIRFRSKLHKKENSSEWAKYKSFLNNVLTTIRKGGHDYCFFVYQITDLLCFENTALKSKYHTDIQCFEVWLDPKNF